MLSNTLKGQRAHRLTIKPNQSFACNKSTDYCRKHKGTTSIGAIGINDERLRRLTLSHL